jgi:hypothetical protein
MINFPYHLARVEGELTRNLYRAAMPMIVRRRVQARHEIPFDVFAYSGEQTLPEQVASIRSLLRYAGRPKSFTVVSDGTYTRPSIQLLERIDPVVKVSESFTQPVSNYPEQLRSYLATHPTGKQLALIMSLPVNGPALYVDSDVRFFAGAADLLILAQTRSVPAFYLADCQFSGDERLLEDASEKNDPANTGFLLLFQKLDWSLGLERFLKLQGAPIFFTNQTIVHLTMQTNRARPFDPRKYVLQLDDQFIYRDLYANKSLAMRHYVNPVRHKFWTSLRR